MKDVSWNEGCVQRDKTKRCVSTDVGYDVWQDEVSYAIKRPTCADS